MPARKPHVYQVTRWGTPPGGASDTRRVDLMGYAKLNSAGGPLCVVNEYISSKIGGLMGLPVPPGGVVEGPGGGATAWLTLSFSATPLPPIDPGEVVRKLPLLASEVVVFDILIGNFDRHAGNLASMSGGRRLEVFDHSHALLGIGGASGLPWLLSMSDKLVITGVQARHCLLDHVKDAKAILAAVDLARREVRDSVLRRVCQEAARLNAGLDSEDATKVAEWLIIRRDKLETLIRREAGEFKAIAAADWGATI